MADQKVTATEPELDEDGKPIPPAEETEDGDKGEEEETEESNEDDGEGGDAKPPEKKEDDPDDAKPDIPVRKSAQQHIIARQRRTIEKLRSKEEEDDDGTDSDEEDEEDDEKLTPKIKGSVAREVERRVTPLLKTIATTVDEEELASLFLREPNAKKYEKRIRAYMEHDNYRGVAPSFIYQGLAFKDAQAIGTKRKTAADVKAGQMRGAGSSRRPSGKTSNTPSIEEMEDMSDEEFGQIQQKALDRTYVSKK